MIKLNCEEEFLINLITDSKNTKELASKLNTEKLLKFLVEAFFFHFLL